MALRYIDKFESIDGTISYSFPTALLSQQIEQGYRTPMSSGVGANYAYDHLGYGVSPKDPRRIAIRALHYESSPTNLQTEIDEAQAECYRIGLGYLYRLDVDGSTYRRCLARLTGAPSITFDGGFQFGVAPVVFNFIAISDWVATTATTGSQLIDSQNESVTVTNTSTLPVYSVTFRLRNTGTTYAMSPVLFNQTTGEYAAFLRNMNHPDHELYLETGARLVQFSTNNGAAYSNDYTNFAGSNFHFEPGNNTLIVCCGRPHILPWLNTIGDPDFTLEWSFYPAFP